MTNTTTQPVWFKAYIKAEGLPVAGFARGEDVIFCATQEMDRGTTYWVRRGHDLATSETLVTPLTAAEAEKQHVHEAPPCCSRRLN